MKVTVSLVTILKQYASEKIGDGGVCDAADGSTLDELSTYLGIPHNVVKIYLVNGLPKQAGHPLQDEVRVKIFSFVGGG